jgi:hypothetical protein
MTDPLADLAQTVRDLVEPYTHREPLDVSSVKLRRFWAARELNAAKTADAQAADTLTAARAAAELLAGRENHTVEDYDEAFAAVRAVLDATRKKADTALRLGNAKTAMTVAKETRYLAAHSSLLDQLAAAVEPGNRAEGGPIPTGPADGCAPWNEPAADALERIDQSARQWASWCRLDTRDTTAGTLRALVGVATVLEVRQQQELTFAARHWRTWARVESGWQRGTMNVDERAGATSDSCPCCEQRRTLRVRGDGSAAWCRGCGAAWSEGDDDLPSVSQLAEGLAERPAMELFALIACGQVAAGLVCATCKEPAVTAGHPALWCSPYRLERTQDEQREAVGA